MEGVSMGRYPCFWNAALHVSKMWFLLIISTGEKSRVPLGFVGFKKWLLCCCKYRKRFGINGIAVPDDGWFC